MFAVAELAPYSVRIVPPTSSLSTGDTLYLSCSIVLANPLTSGTSLEVIWMLPDGSTIMASSADIVSTPSASNNSFSATFNISSLTPSHAGLYQCSVRIASTVPQISSSQSTIGSTNVTISYFDCFISQIALTISYPALNILIEYNLSYDIKK